MATDEVMQSRALWQSRWWIVGASLVGMIVGPGTAITFTLNVFLVPVTSEFHWLRGEFSSGLIASACASTIMTPLFGRLMDRFGIRRIALPVAAIYGLAICSFSLMNADRHWLIYPMFACGSGFGACLGPIVYSKAITAWFDKQRGLALGIATSGVGLGTFIMPQLAGLFIAAFGWRIAYILVGVTTWLLASAMIGIFIREPEGYFARMRAARQEAAQGPQSYGLSTRAAITGTRQFWLLALIFLLEGIANNGILSGHFVAMLTDRGYSPPAAAAILGSSGLAALTARIVVGFCLDYVRGPVFCAGVMLLPVAGVGLLLSGAGGPAPFLAAICLGLAIGAEVDMLGFFVSRYFGRRSFGALYGLIYAPFVFGIGFGPAVLGFGFDHFHRYDPVLEAYLVLLVVAAALFLPLGKYNYPKGSV